MDSALKAVDLIALKPIRDKIIVEGMNFTERYTKGGIFIPSDDMQIQGVRPRWAKIYAVGPDQTELKVGQYVLVAHGRWTRGVNITDPNGKHNIRMVDNNDLLMVSDEEVMDETLGIPLTSSQMNGAPKGGRAPE
jgi:co-chaperonin GroES (HSP10)